MTKEQLLYRIRRLKNKEDRVFLISCLNYVDNVDKDHYTMGSIGGFCEGIFFASKPNSYDEKVSATIAHKYETLENRTRRL